MHGSGPDQRNVERTRKTVVERALETIVDSLESKNPCNCTGSGSAGSICGLALALLHPICGFGAVELADSRNHRRDLFGRLRGIKLRF